MAIKRYTKKPVTIEAADWPFDISPREAHEVTDWINSHGWPWLKGDYTDPKNLEPKDTPGIWIDPADGTLMIRTLEGDHKVTLGDKIIKGVAGEFYPCKPGIFEGTYDAAD